MNTEKLINKGVERHFDGQKVLFKVKSLKEHFDGLQIHDSDILLIEEEDYVIAGDVNFDNATANEVEIKGDAEQILESQVLEEETEEVLVEENAETPVGEIEVTDEEVVENIPTETVVVEENVIAGELNTEA